jgi:hypothetical protein
LITENLIVFIKILQISKIDKTKLITMSSFAQVYQF